LPHQFIDELQEGALLQQFFLVRQAESRTDKTGKPYLSLVLGDKSGTIVARVWNDILKKCPGPFVAGDFVGVKGQVDSYKQELQINVKYMETEESIRSRGGDPAPSMPNCSSRPPLMTGNNSGGSCANWPRPRSSRPCRSWS
jgi:DNA polymerase III alpha subunit